MIKAQLVMKKQIYGCRFHYWENFLLQAALALTLG